MECGSGENVIAIIHEINIHVSAAAGVVAVTLGKAVGRAVFRKHIGAVNLKLQGRGRGPYQAAHSSVADGQAFFAARRAGHSLDPPVKPACGSRRSEPRNLRLGWSPRGENQESWKQFDCSGYR